MKRTISSLFAALVLATAAALPLTADAGIGAFASWWDTKDYGKMFGFGGKVALGLPANFRIEARGSYLESDDYEAADVTLLPIEALVAWHLPLGDVLRPFVGAGVGWYLKDFDWKSNRKEWEDAFEDKDCAGYFAIAGLDLLIGADWAIFAEAKYTLVGEDDKLEWRGSDLKEKYSFDGFSASAGLKIDF